MCQTAFDADTQNVKYSPDGVTPLTLDACVEGLQAKAPHPFESSVGDGAPGNGSGGVDQTDTAVIRGKAKTGISPSKAK